MAHRIEDVSDTAFMVAAYRAMETERAAPLFRDPLAGRLSGEHGKAIVSGLGRRGALGCWALAIRTCIIDDYLQSAIAQGVTLVLNLGAGLDTRPYRLALPKSLQWIEVDFPKVIALKERELTDVPQCRLERVALDLADRAARQRLFAELNQRSEKVLVLTEGVVPYLSNAEVASLADDLKAQSHFALWIVDYFSPEALRFRGRSAPRRGMENAPWRFAPGDWFDFFRAQGWTRREIRYLAVEGSKRGRAVPLSLATKAFLHLRRLFQSRAGRDRLDQFTGYAVLERGESTAPSVARA